MVSVIIPYFNSAKFFEQTLESVLLQSYPNWECLLINDGSTDESVEIAVKFAEKDHRFINITRDQEPKGVSQCRNIGIQESSGDFIVFLDSDDLMDVDCLKKRVEYMEAHDELDFAVFQVETFGLETNKTTEYKADYLASFLRFDFAWTVSSPIWRADFLKSLGGFNTEMSVLEDPELHVRALQLQPKYQVLVDAKPDLFYRIWKESVQPELPRLQVMMDGYFRYLRLVDDVISKGDYHTDILGDGLMRLLKRLRWTNGVTISRYTDELNYFVSRLPKSKIRIKMVQNVLKSVTISGKSKQNIRKEVELIMVILFPGDYFRSYLKI